MTNRVCNCALPALTGSDECCKHCGNYNTGNYMPAVETFNLPLSYSLKSTTCKMCRRTFWVGNAKYCPFCGKELENKCEGCKWNEGKPHGACYGCDD